MLVIKLTVQSMQRRRRRPAQSVTADRQRNKLRNSVRERETTEANLSGVTCIGVLHQCFG